MKNKQLDKPYFGIISVLTVFILVTLLLTFLPLLSSDVDNYILKHILPYLAGASIMFGAVIVAMVTFPFRIYTGDGYHCNCCYFCYLPSEKQKDGSIYCPNCGAEFEYGKGWRRDFGSPC